MIPGKDVSAQDRIIICNKTYFKDKNYPDKPKP